MHTHRHTCAHTPKDTEQRARRLSPPEPQRTRLTTQSHANRSVGCTPTSPLQGPRSITYSQRCRRWWVCSHQSSRWRRTQNRRSCRPLHHPAGTQLVMADSDPRSQREWGNTQRIKSPGSGDLIQLLKAVGLQCHKGSSSSPMASLDANVKALKDCGKLFQPSREDRISQEGILS